MDTRSLVGAVRRAATRQLQARWPAGLFRDRGDRLRSPSPETTGTQPSTSTSCEPATGGGLSHIFTASDVGLHQPVPDAARGTAQPPAA